MHAATRREPRTRRARFAAAARARLVDTEEAGALKLHARAGLRVGHVLLHRHLGQRAQRVGVDVAQKVAVGVYKGVTTCELDELAAETAASMTSKHPDYAQVRISPTRTIRTARSTAFSDATHRNVHLRVSVASKSYQPEKPVRYHRVFRPHR